MPDAFDILMTMSRTNSLYRRWDKFEKRYKCQNNAELERAYLKTIDLIWSTLQFVIPTDSISLFATVPVESD